MATPTLVELGVVVDVALDDGRVINFASDKRPEGKRPPGPLLCWFPDRDELIWFAGLRLPRARPLADDLADDPATKLRRKWTRGREPATMRTLDVDVAGRRARVGKAAAIRYHSDKWNDRGVWVLYRHEFGPSVDLFTGGTSTHIVRGGRLRITGDGIEG